MHQQTLEFATKGLSIHLGCLLCAGYCYARGTSWTVE